MFVEYVLGCKNNLELRAPMYTFVDETADGTVLYEVRLLGWCLCWAFYYGSEIFEITGVPVVYRRFRGVSSKPTFIEWLKMHRRLWSKKTVYPKGTKFNYNFIADSPGRIGYLFGSRE